MRVNQCASGALGWLRTMTWSMLLLLCTAQRAQHPSAHFLQKSGHRRGVPASTGTDPESRHDRSQLISKNVAVQSGPTVDAMREVVEQQQRLYAAKHAEKARSAGKARKRNRDKPQQASKGASKESLQDRSKETVKEEAKKAANGRTKRKAKQEPNHKVETASIEDKHIRAFTQGEDQKASKFQPDMEQEQVVQAQQDRYEAAQAKKAELMKEEAAQAKQAQAEKQAKRQNIQEDSEEKQMLREEPIEKTKEVSKETSEEEPNENVAAASEEKEPVEDKEEPAEVPAGEAAADTTKEEDTSAEKIGPEGLEMIKEMIRDEEDTGEVKVVKTPEEEEAEKVELQHEAENKDELETAAEHLFAERSDYWHDDEKHCDHGHKPREFDVDSGEGFGAELDSEQCHSLHEKDLMLDSSVRFILVFTPILVGAYVTYFFCISKLQVETGMELSADVTTKLHSSMTGWRRKLGNVIEHPLVNMSVLLLILIDICCATVHDLLNQTDLLNPKYNRTKYYIIHTSHKVSIYILCTFLVEQMLHIICFGKAFFYHFWYVCDLVTVYVSLMGETVAHEKFGDVVSFLICMRLWKVTTVIFDVFLAGYQNQEMQEKILKKKERMHSRSPKKRVQG
mmetsp:Transcript_23935/g.44345  ORF Transcript_23935/g.44345 Transcript_23935/m.44345 type:complete len:623 (-) Transcript_23935:71-1939(-)